ncbi:stage III sporulation protein AF [Brevibacillus migulae]|uniref:stage III sporulation protein AF n=1 Tax=Brevibacillus migulae TaxID=1644114 RepID=UPI0014319329|nr:stage III sporulation protein AF [Brevibacillus migulae]
MDWLNIWLKKIILLVLLAAFLDLILPNTSMQRYVKMVMGLILLLTILTPVFSIFNLSQDELAFKLSRYQEDFQNATKADWQPLAKKLMGQQTQQVTSYMKQQIETAVRLQVKETYGEEPAAVDVQIAGDNPEAPVIKQITLTMAEAGSKGAGEEESVQVIRPIEEVSINLSEKPQVDSASNSQQQLRAEDMQMAKWLAQNWSIEADQVQVIRDTKSK